MNIIERFVYDILKNNAAVKDTVVGIYQGVFSIFGKVKGAIRTNYEITIYDDFFFGFHDKPSLNSSGLLMGHTATSNFKNGIGTAKIGYYDINKEAKFIEVAQTACCNNQQGSMLAWVSDTKIAFNDYINNEVVTVIADINTQEKETLPFHFASVSPSGELFSAINFCRFGKGLSGYGYDIEYNEKIKQDAQNPISDSELGDLVIYSQTNSQEVFRLSAIKAREISIASFPELAGYEYFSHTCFSPDSNLMSFMYRSFNGKKNSSQLFVVNVNTGELKALPTAGMVSHLHWLTETKIIAYCNIINGKDGYYIFDTETDNVRALENEQLTADGHPHSDPNNKSKFVTDTYPNRERRQMLYLVDEAKNTSKQILDVYSPKKFRGADRVDFHPRYSQCGRYITIDSPHLNSRSQIVIKL